MRPASHASSRACSASSGGHASTSGSHGSVGARVERDLVADARHRMAVHADPVVPSASRRARVGRRAAAPRGTSPGRPPGRAGARCRRLAGARPTTVPPRSRPGPARSVRRSVTTVAPSSAPVSIATHRSGIESSAPAARRRPPAPASRRRRAPCRASAWNSARSSSRIAISGKRRRTPAASSSSNGTSPARIAAASASSFASGPRSTCPVSTSRRDVLLGLEAAPALERLAREAHVPHVVVGDPDRARRAGRRRHRVAAPPAVDADDGVPPMRERAGRREPGDPEPDHDHVGALARHREVGLHGATNPTGPARTGTGSGSCSPSR